jgi:hypothetical protein
MARLRGVTDPERTLLKAAFGDDALREALTPVLTQHPLFEALETHRIFRAIAAIVEGGGAFGYAEVEARLEESDRALLAAVVLADKTSERRAQSEPAPTVTVEQARACLEALDQKWRKSRMAEMDHEIKDAERRGDLETAFRLMGERRELEKLRWRMAG